MRFNQYRTKVQSLLREHVPSDIPVDVDRVARQFGVVEIEPRIMSIDGYLGRRDDGELVIRFNEESGAARCRFTIAHEVAHVLFGIVHGKAVKAPAARGATRDDYEEWWANRVAAEILLPETALMADLRRKPASSWRTVRQLSYRYGVSIAALARRLRELPEVAAVQLRIIGKVGSTATSWSVWGSDWARFYLADAPVHEANRIIRESGYTTSHAVGIELDGQRTMITCEGARRHGEGSDTVYDAIGWTISPESGMEISRREKPAVQVV
ncbi:MAG: ImmA/IrrE family metallo-endopeptidase [Planctomycetota bacterium]|nr:MAG: ImmA/IrrE family metallo-endopeptidase [Planctomycetota bacterium]REJ95696.1 MAG: ImmA/IrrE family metallo-endopeptidase [Planctomycetota bacterium]REK22930.1 MAG: ImmA/IrrE family metallo-endopeptidase [Planctomycetota bacterium]REK27782.1 MAG: ImmA/IrrE family metallo-endopeptidase [Planctomycetota bacterium]